MSTWNLNFYTRSCGNFLIFEESISSKNNPRSRTSPKKVKEKFIIKIFYSLWKGKIFTSFYNFPAEWVEKIIRFFSPTINYWRQMQMEKVLSSFFYVETTFLILLMLKHSWLSLGLWIWRLWCDSLWVPCVLEINIFVALKWKTPTSEKFFEKSIPNKTLFPKDFISNFFLDVRIRKDKF